MSFKLLIGAIIAICITSIILVIVYRSKAKAYEQQQQQFENSLEQTAGFLDNYNTQISTQNAYCFDKIASGIWDDSCFGKKNFSFNLANFFS